MVILNTKWLQIPQKVVYEKFYVHKIAAVDLSKIYVLKNAMKTCKPNNRHLNRDWIIVKTSLFKGNFKQNTKLYWQTESLEILKLKQFNNFHRKRRDKEITNKICQNLRKTKIFLLTKGVQLAFRGTVSQGIT